MQVPLKLSYQGLKPSESLNAFIRKKVNQLDRIGKQLISVRVTIGTIQRRHLQGNRYQVRVVLVLPRKEIIVDRNSGLNHDHEKLSIAVRDSFWAARRQLFDHVKNATRMKRSVKQKNPFERVSIFHNKTSRSSSV